MSELFSKGTAIGFDLENWKNDRKLLSSLLLSYMQTWLMKNYNSQDQLKGEITDIQKREFGKVKSAFWGFESDLHNLTINYHLMNSIVFDNKADTNLKTLYLSSLVENYIVNIRSIYDFCSIFPRTILSQNAIKQISGRKNPDSLSTLIKYCNSIHSKELPDELAKLLNKIEPDFVEIKTIRDLIIHKGKETIIEIRKREILFRIPSKSPYGEENSLPNILELNVQDYPLFDYLRKLTLKLFDFMENLSVILINEANKIEEYRVELTALIGICINDFNDFLYPTEKNKNCV